LLAVAILDEREAIHDGHHEVEDDRRGAAGAHGIEGFATVRGQVYGKTFAAQRVGDEPANRGVVIYDQDVRL
jgi:hypothetical protein